MRERSEAERNANTVPEAGFDGSRPENPRGAADCGIPSHATNMKKNAADHQTSGPGVHSGG